jgi:hypothetical protein
LSIIVKNKQIPALAAAAAPADDDKRRWFRGVKRDDNDDAPTTADPCIYKNVTLSANIIAPLYDTYIQANSATTTGKPLLLYWIIILICRNSHKCFS